MKLQVLIVLVVAVFLSEVAGHGMVMDPVNRGSRWRIDGSDPKNYNDNANYCGGAGYQHLEQGGRCGVCGDPYGASTPRDHEFGGMYGSTIVKTYEQGSIIPVTVKLTANHLGHFVFKICNLDNSGESDACFDRNPVQTASGQNYEPEAYLTGDFVVSLRLPQGLSCTHCVLQWTYNTANSWGTCPDGSGALGCGPQETFRTCSDIRIH